jgi:Arc/MetJ-type ribon-helix-helix transcriptional regulator
MRLVYKDFMASVQISLRLPERTMQFIDELVARSTYGDSRADVIRRFVDEKIRDAQRDGDLGRAPGAGAGSE